MSSRFSTARLIAGYTAIASAIPYLALKLVWLAGGTLGVADLALMRHPSTVVLNAVTAGMDVVGIVLALALTHGWGARSPAWLLLPPMWVATGLLATFVLGVPIVAMLSTVAPDSVPAITGGPVKGWVYALVYVEFAGLGVGLMTAFFFHAKARWAEVFQPPAHVVETAGGRSVHAALANAAAPVTMLLAAVHLIWAFVAARTMIGSVINGISGVLMFAAAGGVLMMVHRIGENLPGWLPVVMAWTGTGSMFGWGLWQTANALGRTALMNPAEGSALVNLVGLLRLLLGLVLGLVTLLVLAERNVLVPATSLTDPAVGQPAAVPQIRQHTSR